MDEPVGRIDPEGLKTSVVIWHPQGFSSSSFGHVSTTIDDSSYSWEGTGMNVEPRDRYYEKNKDRYGSELHLALDRYEEEKLREHLQTYEKETGKYSSTANNCVDPVRSGLDKIGVKAEDDLFPMGFKQNLEKTGVVAKQETLDRNEINVFGSKQGTETAPAAKPNAEDEEE